MSEHNTLTDPYLHEPKGAASAPAGAAYISDGAGSGTWQTMLTEDQLTLQTNSMSIISGTGTKALLASDISLSTSFIKYDLDWAAGYSSGTDLSFVTDKIDVATDGAYLISFWADVEVTGGVGNSKFAITISVDDATTGIIPGKIIAQSDFSGDIRNVAATEIQTLTSGSSLSLWVASEDAVTLNIEAATLTLMKV